MMIDNQVFVAWEERIISLQKGNRVVHYYLKESSDDSILAVVGTERSIRHMIYIVSNDFVDAYGSTGIITYGTKWRARWEVVEWLTELVSEFCLPLDVSNYQTIKSGQFLSSRGLQSAGVQNMTNRMDQIQISRQCKIHGSEIAWSGEAWICSKQLKHYPAFCMDKTLVAVYSFVLILAEAEKRYLGYLEDLYEDKKGEKMVQVRWLYHNHEVKHTIPELNAHPDEVFITPHVQGISAKCVVSVAAVLTPNHYEKCLAILPEKSSAGIYLCHRELKRNKIKPFSLSKLRGYDNQELLSLLQQHHDLKNKAKVHRPTEERKDFYSEEPARQCNRRTRSQRGYHKPERFHSGLTSLVPENHTKKCDPAHHRLKLKLPSQWPASNKLDGSEPSQVSSKFDQKNIELLCQDSGIRGCWFRCKILQTSKNNIRVQYNDVQDVDGTGKLEEWVPASKVAIPDKLGMRCAGRLTVRPWPAHSSSDCSFEVGDAVDAWRGDGWWEGVIIGLDSSGSDNIEVYFPGENNFLTIQKKDLRPSRDWVDHKWVKIEAKRDIISFISSTHTGEVSNHQYSRSATSEVPVRLKLKPSEDGNQKLPSSAALAKPELEQVGGLNLKKRLCIHDADNLIDKEHNSASKANGKVQSVAKDTSHRRRKLCKGQLPPPLKIV